MKRIDDDIRREHGDFDDDDDMTSEERIDREFAQAFIDEIVRETMQRTEDAILVDGMIHELMRDCNMMKTQAPEIYIWNINGLLHRAKCLRCGRVATTDMFHRQYVIDGQHGITSFGVKVNKSCQCGHTVFRIQARRA